MEAAGEETTPSTKEITKDPVCAQVVKDVIIESEESNRNEARNEDGIAEEVAKKVSSRRADVKKGRLLIIMIELV